jgi:ABC-type glycerol-3-phosphate transport system substrate-binding protein
MYKKILAAACAAALTLVMFAGCGGIDGIPTEYVEPDFSTEDSVNITWLITTQQQIKLSETPAFKNLLSKLNIKITLTEKGTADYNTYKNNQLASNNFPDIVSSMQSFEAKDYGSKGLFVELSQYLDFMPNYKEKVTDAVDADYDNYAMLYNAAGEMYSVNHYNYDPVPLWDFSYNTA